MAMASGKRLPRLVLGTAILFLLGGLADTLVGMSGGAAAALWPGGAIMLGLLIAEERNRRDVAAIATGGAAGTLAWHFLDHGTPAIAAAGAAANLASSLLAYWLLRARARSGEIFARASDVTALIAACAGSSLVAVAIGKLIGVPAGPAFHGWLGRYAAILLSMLVTTPIVVVLARLVCRRDLDGFRIGEIVLVLGLVAAVTEMAFLDDHLPVLFMVVPAVLLAAFRLRVLGAICAVAIVAILSVHATASGAGPVALALPAPGDRMLVLELFLACCFLSALPVAAVLAERDARAAEASALAERFRTVLETIAEVIFRMDREGRWDYLNPAWTALSGRPVGESMGKAWGAHVDAADRADVVGGVERVLAGERESLRRVVRFTTPLGPRWTELFVQPLRGLDGAITGATGTLRDIDDRKRLEDHVAGARRHAEQRAHEAILLATTDELTGIANRRAFMRQLDREIAGAADFGWPLAVAMFDVDHFKRVNDAHGHAVGDRVLQQIARRASAAVRGGDMVGRVGGEEFGILMPGASAEDAAIVAERLREAVESPLAIDAEELPTVTVSIGIAERDGEGDAAALLAAADAALYAAKNAGRNRVRIAA